MRTVSGRRDRVVIVGAGLGGLSCALRLAGAGHQVTVLERATGPGGRAGLLERGGYRFDTGPAVLTMPELLDETLAAVGERLGDWLDLIRLEPAYRAHFPDGSTLDVSGDTARMAGEVSRVCGPREADRYLRFVDHAQRLWHLARRDFIERNLDGPRDLLTADLLRLVAAGGFRSLQGKIDHFFHDPRTRQIFSFQATSAGLAPHDALGLYAVIAYLDTVAGVYFPRGGIHAVPRALASAADKHGVRLRYDTEVVRVEVRGDRATGVITATDERLPADVVVLNPDLPIAYRDLLPGLPRRTGRLRLSPSAVVLHVGSAQRYGKIAHHNLHFGRSWRTYDEVIRRGRRVSELGAVDPRRGSAPGRETMRGRIGRLGAVGPRRGSTAGSGTPIGDLSLLVSNPTRNDPGLAPPDRETYTVLAPAPNLVAGDIEWNGEFTGRYAEGLVATLEERGYRDFGEAAEVIEVVTPADWAEAGLAGGTPFAAAHTLRQSGPFRPDNLHPSLSNVVFVGSGTRPGIGVPMVLISGKLAAARITGHRP